MSDVEPTGAELDRWRQALEAVPVDRSAPEGGGGWSSETIRRAAAGELDPEATAAIVEAAVTDPELRAGLAVAIALADDGTTETETETHPAANEPPTSSSRRWLLGTVAALAAAAAVVLFLGRPQPPPPAPVFRGGEAGSVTTEHRDGAVLSGDTHVLAWEAEGSDLEYRVRVSSADGSIAREFAGLREPRLELPRDFVDTARGTVLLWEVEVRTPSGKRYRSETFEVRLR